MTTTYKPTAIYTKTLTGIVLHVQDTIDRLEGDPTAWGDAPDTVLGLLNDVLALIERGECPAGGAHEWVRERFGSAVHCDHCGASAEREPVVGGRRWEHDPQTGEWVRVQARQPDPCTGDEVPF